MKNRWNKGGQQRPRGHFQHKRRPTQAEINFNRDVIAAAAKPKKHYVSFLLEELAAESGSPWTVVSLATALHRFGKSRGQSDPSTLGLLLNLFATRFNGCTEPLRAQHVGNAFYGLRGIDASVLDRPGKDALTAVLMVLAELAGSCTEPLKAQEVGNAFYGLQGIDASVLDRPGIDALTAVLLVLAELAGSCTEPLGAQAVGNAFYGLQGIDASVLDKSGKDALTAVLKVLAELAGECTEPLRAQHVGNAFYGLRGIDASVLDRPGKDAVTAVLRVLAELAGRCSEPLDPQAVGNAFYGLRHQLRPSLNSAQVIPLVAAIVDRIRVTDEHAKPQHETVRELCCALRCGHDAREDLSKSLDLLWNLLEELPAWVTDANPAPGQHLLALMEQEQVYALYGRPVPAEVRKTFDEQQAACRQLLHDCTNENERAVGSLLQDRLGVPVQVGHLLKGFELDLYFRFEKAQYDVELDGPHHFRLTERLNDLQRDQFLHSEGIRVLRISVQNSSPKAIVDMIMHELGAVTKQHAEG